MNKKEARHQLIRSLILETHVHTQQQLQELLQKNGISVTQATLSRDIKELNLIKVNNDDTAHYIIHNISQSKWEQRLRIYMEDALVMLRPVQHQIILKTLPGLAQSFGAILDELDVPEIVATICGDDVCMVICETPEDAIKCFNHLKKYTPPFFFSQQ